MEPVWWSLKEAASASGLTVEGVRRWALADPPRVRTREVMVGKKMVREVLVSDVQREAGISARYGSRLKIIRDAEPGTPPTGEMRDQLAMQQEVARRYRLIDELRAEIEQRHLAIEGHQRDIATMLQAPTQVPNT